MASYLSANGASACGVILAAAAGRCFLSDSLKVRQFGVLLFKARDFMDSLDGWLARAASRGRRMRMTVEPDTLGYYLDGICDGIADVFLFVSILSYFHRNGLMQGGSGGGGSGNGSGNGGGSYLRLDVSAAAADLLPHNEKKKAQRLITQVKTSKQRVMAALSPEARRFAPYFFFVLTVAGQHIVSAIAWNYNLILYHEALETAVYADTPARAIAQNDCLKSSTMWMVIYFWRFFNPHSLNQYILLTILYNKSFEFFCAVQFLGYLPILFSAGLSQVYYKVAVWTIMSA